jgi:hypothetical protein
MHAAATDVSSRLAACMQAFKSEGHHSNATSQIPSTTVTDVITSSPCHLPWSMLCMLCKFRGSRNSGFLMHAEYHLRRPGSHLLRLPADLEP